MASDDLKPTRESHDTVITRPVGGAIAQTDAGPAGAVRRNISLPSWGRSRSQQGTLLLLFAVTSLLGLIIPGLFLFSIPGKMSTNVVLTLGIVAWATLRLVYTASKGQRRLALMCSYVFVYVFLGVQPTLSVWTQTYPLQPSLTDDQTAFTVCLVVLGIAAFEVGYAMRTRSASRKSGPHTDSGIPSIQPRPVTLFMLWLGMVAAVGLAVLAMLHYGPTIFLGVRGGGFAFAAVEGAAMSQSEWLLVIYGLRVLLAALLFISVYLWKMRKHHDWPGHSIWRLRATLVVLALVNLVVSNPLSAARLWSGSVLLTVLFIVLPWKGARSFLVWSTVASLSLLLLFAGIDPRRILAAPLLRGEEVSVLSTVKVISESVQGLQTDANFDAFQMVALTRSYADQVGYSFGRQMLLPAFFWVPRAIWPGKPSGTGDAVAESRGFDSLNVSAPLWAEGYLNLGVLGLALFLGIFGRLSRMSDDFLVRTSRKAGPIFPTIVSSFFAANTFILLRGDLTTGTMYLQMVIGFTFVIILLIKRHARDSAPAFSQRGSHSKRLAPTPGQF